MPKIDDLCLCLDSRKGGPDGERSETSDANATDRNCRNCGRQISEEWSEWRVKVEAYLYKNSILKMLDFKSSINIFNSAL